MPNHTPFRLNRSGMLLALISAAFAGESSAATGGRVDFATTGATVAGTDGRQRPLAKGAEIGTGDTVRTDATARAQIRFTDGSYVSLQPNTEFAIKDYRFDGKTDGSESGIFGLAKGAMRTVTGLIGRVNRNKYQITTPTATVGIRGTGGRIEVLLDGSTLVAGTSGIWVVSNPAGTIDVPAGTSGKAPVNPSQPPQQTLEQPKNDPAPPTLPPVIIGTTKPLVTPLVSGGGYEASAVFTIFGGANSYTSSGPADAIFDSTGRLTDVKDASGRQLSMLPGASHADFQTDGILAWGRWIGPLTINICEGVCGANDYNANQGLHYVIGKPTAVLPTTGGGEYRMVGATQPTYTDGSTAPGKFIGSLSVDFANPKIVANFNVAMPDRSYGFTATTTNVSSAFSMSTFTVAGCASPCCSASANGFFAGASAERAGVTYQVFDTKTVQGAAAFAK